MILDRSVALSAVGEIAVPLGVVGEVVIGAMRKGDRVATTVILFIMVTERDIERSLI